MNTLLTPAYSGVYSPSADVNPSAGFSSSVYVGGQPPLAVFLRPLHGKPSYGRAVRETFGSAGANYRSANPHVRAHPFSSGKRVLETLSWRSAMPSNTSPRVLESINPLISEDGWNLDTAHNVRCAIDFMADAVPHIITRGNSSDNAHGAHILLRACAAALEVCHE